MKTFLTALVAVQWVSSGHAADQPKWIEELARAENLRRYSSVPSLFELIELSTEQHPDVVKLSFDEAYGFPTSIYIDPDSETTDDELIVDVKGLVPIQ